MEDNLFENANTSCAPNQFWQKKTPTQRQARPEPEQITSDGW
jgi:hypothetical protein